MAPTLKSDARDGSFQLAKLVQQKLLPSGCPQCQCADLAVRCLMLDGVGGDFYDFIHADPARPGFLIGDVTGHGLESAFIMAWILGYVRKAGMEHTRPSGLIADLRNLISQIDWRQAGASFFCTAFYAIYDPSTHGFTYCNAGHPPPLLFNRSTNQCAWLEPHCALIGSLPGDGCTELERRITVSSHDRLLVYTDGLIEVANASKEPWGTERLSQCVVETQHLSANKAADVILDTAKRHGENARFRDDVTLIIIDFSQGRS